MQASRVGRVVTWSCAAVVTLLLTGCDPPGHGQPVDPSTDPEAATGTAPPPAGFGWVGGPENGLRLAVPADWVAIPPESAELSERRAINVMDSKGARSFDDYEAHLLASCQPNPGVPSMDALEAAAPAQYADYRDARISAVTLGGLRMVTVSYTDEASDGTPEYWYEYVFLTDDDRLCLISLTTPLPPGPARDRMKRTFDRIGGAIEILPATR